MTAVRRHRPHLTAWLDVSLAAAFLAACETEVGLRLHTERSSHHWPTEAVVAVIGVIALGLAIRRRTPLLAAGMAMAALVALALSLSHLSSVTSPELVLVLAPYSVAAYSTRDRGVVGLFFCVIAGSILSARSLNGASAWVFILGVITTSWIAGQFTRGRRSTAIALHSTMNRIAIERESQEALAIADQRNRIARELQTVIADNVSAMVVQARVAQRLLDSGAEEADNALAMIEAAGRRALSDLRRVLGVLRHPDDAADLAPQPGVGQVPALIERARAARPDIGLHVEGEPTPLPASIDIAVYRLLEDALHVLAFAVGPLDVDLRFTAGGVALAITAPPGVHLDWPTIAMRERIAICQGTLDIEADADARERLVIDLPGMTAAAFA